MANMALRRSLRALAHPLSLGAILLLLVNDQLIRWRWPSWWTGKAGDVAWLFFAPFALAAIIALLLPRRLGLISKPSRGGSHAAGLPDTAAPSEPSTSLRGLHAKLPAALRCAPGKACKPRRLSRSQKVLCTFSKRI